MKNQIDELETLLAEYQVENEQLKVSVDNLKLRVGNLETLRDGLELEVQRLIAENNRLNMCADRALTLLNDPESL